MTDSDKRRDVRTKFRAEVKVSHPEVGELATHTGDISETGAFILSEGHTMPEINEIVAVQVQGMGDGEAPVVKMRVVRHDKNGIGLEYVDSED